MPNTQASVLYPLIRAALGDYDPTNFRYTDYALSSQVAWTVVLVNDPNLTTYTDGCGLLWFNSTLTNVQQAEISLQAAINIISMVDSEFSYRTPVLHVIRKGGSDRLFSYLRELLSTLRGGQFVFSVDQDLTDMVWEITRTVNGIANAIAAGPGSQ